MAITWKTPHPRLSLHRLSIRCFSWRIMFVMTPAAEVAKRVSDNVCMYNGISWVNIGYSFLFSFMLFNGDLDMYVCMYLSMYLSIFLAIYLSMYLSIYLFIYLSIYLIYLIYLSNLSI